MLHFDDATDEMDPSEDHRDRRHQSEHHHVFVRLILYEFLLSADRAFHRVNEDYVPHHCRLPCGKRGGQQLKREYYIREQHIDIRPYVVLVPEYVATPCPVGRTTALD